MIQVEFMAYWPGDYSNDDKEPYRIAYGEDQSFWPKSESYSQVVIDISKTIRFNPGSDKEKTVVDLCGGNSLTLAISFPDYKKVLSHHDIYVYNYKDALQNNNKPV
jgi:hypothetical protein